MKGSELAEELSSRFGVNVPMKHRDTLGGLVEYGGDRREFTLIVIRVAVELLKERGFSSIDPSELLAAIVFPDRLEAFIQERQLKVSTSPDAFELGVRLAIFLSVQDRRPTFNVHRSSDF